MKFLLQRLNVADFLHNGILLLLILSSSWLLLLLVASSTDIHVELSNLVSILARCRHLNGTSPVEVEVAQGETELLDVYLGELGFVEWDMEVSG